MTAPSSALQEAAERHVIGEETILHHQAEGDEYLAVTDRRVLIVKVGSILGERSQSIPLGAIGSMATTVKEGRVRAIQFSVPGRSLGEISISGEDLGPVMRAVVTAMPSHLSRTAEHT